MMYSHLKLNIENPQNHLLMAFVVGMPPEKADNILVDHTAMLMRDRLKDAMEEGRHGWNMPVVDNKDLIDRAIKNISKGDYLDAINLLAMVTARQTMFIEVPFEFQKER